MANIWQKIKNIKVHVFVVGSIFSIALCLVLIDFGKSYSVETTVIVLPKSEVTAVQLGKITKNIAAFPQMLAFYDKLLFDNPKIQDPLKGEEGDLRQKYWKTRITTDTRQFSRSSLVTVKVSAKDQNEAKLLAAKSMQTLFAVTSKFYNTQTELDIKVANGPITRAHIPFVGLIIAAGLIAGFALALVLEEMLQTIENKLTGKVFMRSAGSRLHSQVKTFKESFFKPQLPEIDKLEDIYKEDLIAPSTAESVGIEKENILPEIAQLHKKKQSQQYPNFPEMPVHEIKIASAPENLPFGNVPNNLPIGGNTYQFTFGAQKTKEEAKKDDMGEQQDSSDESTEKEEPTEQELKERLNQLLKGGM